MLDTIGNPTDAYTLVKKQQYELLVFEGDEGVFISVKNGFDNTSIDIALTSIDDAIKNRLINMFNLVFPDENRINDNLYKVFEKYVATVNA